MTPGIYTLSNAEYHADPAIGNSGIGIIATKTPAHYYASLSTPRKETPAMAAGTRLHYALLEPDLYDRLYGVAPDVDKRTNAGKAAMAEWEAKNPGVIAISGAEFDQARRIRDALLSNNTVSTLLVGAREQSIFAEDPVTGVRTKCRPDNRGVSWLTDLKSTDNAAQDDFMWSAYRYGYHRQAAWYLDVCQWSPIPQANKPDKFFFIAFEKEPPYAFMVYEASVPMLSRGRDSYRMALDTYAECLRTNTWPGYDAGVHLLDLPESIHKKLDAADNDEVIGITYDR